MSNISSNTILQQNDSLITSEIDDELLILDSKTGEYFKIDPIGLSIWKLLTEPTKVQQLLDKLVEDFEVEEAQCKADTLPFIEMLVEKEYLLTV